MPEEKNDDPCMVLFRHVPKAAHELVFGNDEAPPTKQGAASVAATRRIPAITVYVITSSDEDEESLQFMFKDVPHRIFKLRTEDFLGPSPSLASTSTSSSTEEAAALAMNGGTMADNARFKGLSAKRAAGVAGALEIGTPVLIFEAGTALTYTAIDSHGKVLGGGVSPGFNARFRALYDYCDVGVARVPWEDFKKVQWEAMEKQQPLDVFESDLKSEIHTDVLGEVAGKCRTVLKHFLRHVQDQKDQEKENSDDTPSAMDTATAGTTADSAGGAPTTTTTTTTAAAATMEPPKSSHDVCTPTEAKTANPTKLPIVVATGGDSEIIKNLMAPDHSYIVPVEPETSHPVDGKDFVLYTLKHLQHYGLASILTKQSKLAEGVSEADPINQIRSDLIGQRVAKHFPVADLDGEFVYRGSIVSIRVGAANDDVGGGDKMSLVNDWFFVRYDDGDKEHLDLVTLYGT
jgi:Type III pantothenate kinase